MHRDGYYLWARNYKKSENESPSTWAPNLFGLGSKLIHD